MNAPLCENCRFFVKGRYPRTDSCGRFIAYRGRGKIVYEWTDSVRFSERKCGPTGKLFEPREKKVRSEREETLRHLFEDEE
jgi:hypothetical protein